MVWRYGWHLPVAPAIMVSTKNCYRSLLGRFGLVSREFMKIYAPDRPDVPPFEASARLRHEVAYFMSVPGEKGTPQVDEGEYWIDAVSARRWLDDGVISVVSPLDSENQTEVELSEEQEAWLEWMLAHRVSRIRFGK